MVDPIKRFKSTSNLHQTYIRHTSDLHQLRWLYSQAKDSKVTKPWHISNIRDITQYKLERRPRCWSWTGLNKCYVFLVTLFWKTCRNMSGLQWLQWLQWLQVEGLGHLGLSTSCFGCHRTLAKCKEQQRRESRFKQSHAICANSTIILSSAEAIRQERCVNHVTICDSLLGSFAKESWECRFEKRWLEDLLVVQLFWSSRRCRPLSFAMVAKSELID